MLAPGALAPDGRYVRRRDDLRPALRIDDNPLSLLRPTGSSVAEGAVYITLIVHEASLRLVNCWSDPSLILVKLWSTQDIKMPMSRSEQAVWPWRNRKMTSAKLVAIPLEFWQKSCGPSGSLACVSRHSETLVPQALYLRIWLRVGRQKGRMWAYHLHNTCCYACTQSHLCG